MDQPIRIYWVDGYQQHPSSSCLSLRQPSPSVLGLLLLVKFLHGISYLTDFVLILRKPTSSDIVQVPIGITQQLDTPKIVRPAKSQSPSRVRLQSDLADSGILHPLLSLFHTRQATLSLYRTLGKQKNLKCRQLRHLNIRFTLLPFSCSRFLASARPRSRPRLLFSSQLLDISFDQA